MTKASNLTVDMTVVLHLHLPGTLVYLEYFTRRDHVKKKEREREERDVEFHCTCILWFVCIFTVGFQ